ncbi:chloramphenicol acetyltransferase [Christiangramia salexigens]|uniref:Chloramphenicol acetyltransferase n=1 Tax=Christiangramia salexigens TaxID=1913577 RepID=A0A1L3J5X6_9FLAO|nr:chloramphenicol acetyltransferase [Christiangramia salexigens]APG60516.1 chloramphenicol acetyltransferase [Christiangramia salexigens]
MRKEIDLKSWNRKEHFEFFSKFEEPFYGMSLKIDCTGAYQRSKELDVSFFVYYLHQVATAVNQTRAFRYRIQENRVYEYEQIDISATILREDHTFGFSYIDYNKNLKVFKENVGKEIHRVKNGSGLFPEKMGSNVIHFSANPWIDFTSLSHARSFSMEDSSPKISVGKMTTQGSHRSMPLSVHVHHALVDGYDIGLFVDKLQALMQ